jgi:pyridoxal phosphate enzyme (YggS family)
MDTISANLQAVKARIAAAAKQYGRQPDSIELLAVSKTFGADAVRAAHAAGQCAFGENYVQEALDKIAALPDLPLIWHFIGPIQSNKTRQIAEHFDWVHGVDRPKIAERLAVARPAGLPPLQVCIQVNIGDEDSKSGVAPADTAALARAVTALPNLRLRGLMAIPPASDDFATQRGYFAELRRLADELAAAGIALGTLSMGMSADLEAAVAEGATMVRIGTAIFGARQAR